MLTKKQDPAAPLAEDDKGDDMLDALLATMADGPEAAPEIQAAPEPQDPPAPPSEPTPPSPATPETPAPANPPVKVVRKPALTREDLESAISKISAARPPIPAAPAAPAPAPVPVVDSNPDLASLNPDQRDEFEIAAYAEKTDPKYKGRAQALLAGWKAVDAYVAQRAADGDAVDPESDPELAKFIAKTVPKIPNAELRRIDRLRVTEEAISRVRSEVGVDIQKAHQLAHLARVEPIIQQDMAAFTTETTKELTSEDPLEVDVYSGAIESAKQYAEEYLRLANGAINVQESPLYPQIYAFIEAEGANRVKSGTNLVKDGKTFATISEFAALPAEEKAKRWVFSKSDVLGLIRATAVQQAKNAVKAEEEQAARRGFVRKAAVAPKPNPAPTPSPVNPKPSAAAPQPAVAPRAPGAAPLGASLHVPSTPDRGEFDPIDTLGMK